VEGGRWFIKETIRFRQQSGSCYVRVWVRWGHCRTAHLRRILLSHSIIIHSTHKHCGGLPEKTNVPHAGHLNKKDICVTRVLFTSSKTFCDISSVYGDMGSSKSYSSYFTSIITMTSELIPNIGCMERTTVK